MQVARVVGWAIGLASLFSVFFLPFWNLTSGSSTQFDTLYTALRFTLGNISTILQWNISQVTILALVVLGAGALVALSGALGVYPRGGGIIGVLGMLGLTIGPVFLFAGYAFSFDNFGTGFWALWVLSAANVFVGLALRGRGASPAPIPNPVTAAPSPEPAASPAP